MEPFAWRFINITRPFIDFLEIFLFFSEDVGGRIETRVHRPVTAGAGFCPCVIQEDLLAEMEYNIQCYV